MKKLSLKKSTIRHLTTAQLDADAAKPTRSRVNSCVICQFTRPTR